MARSEQKRLRGAVFAAAMFASLTACSALIGLDDFEKIECTGGRCDAAPFDGSTNRRDAAADARVDAGPGSEEAFWAKWPMPNPRDAGPDGAVAVGQLTQAGPDEIVDATTGLVWRATSEPPRSLEEARATCVSAPGGPWRLPKRIELVTILDHSVTGAKSNPILQSVQSAYWTSSEGRPLGDPAEYWVVDFQSGQVRRQAAVAPAAVRCVKGAL